MLEFGSGFGSVFFDDSRHDRCNFALGAFVCAHGAAIDKLPKLLVAHGLTPYVDEFKSGTIMRDNPRLRDLREEFLRLPIPLPARRCDFTTTPSLFSRLGGSVACPLVV